MSDLLPGLEQWDATELRRQLVRGGYHVEALEALGMPEKWLRSVVPGGALLGRVIPGSPMDILIRLFTLAEGVAGDAALRALGECAAELTRLEFLATAGGLVYSRYQLIPIRGGWVACDFMKPRPEIGEEGSAGAGYVMGIGPSTLLLRGLTPPVKKGRVLELGCGIAWLSAQLRQAGLEVVSADLNPRALRLAEFQARLRGIDGMDLRQGDGFAPVAGETFDLIVSNPPYVQSPGGERVYREGKEGESILARLLRDLPYFLAPGGIAVVLVNWSHRDAESAVEEGPLAWVPEAGLRRWLFQNDTWSPTDYAWLWIGQDPKFTGDAALAEMRRWLDFYQAQGVGALSGGFLVLQRCEPGEEWTRVDSREVKDLLPAAGAEVMTILENETWLQRGVTEETLLSTRYRVPDGLCAEMAMELGEKGWQHRTIRLQSPGKLAYDGQIDENLLRLLELCRAGMPPLEMVRELREKPEFSEMEGIETSVAELVRGLVGFGMLVAH